MGRVGRGKVTMKTVAKRQIGGAVPSNGAKTSIEMEVPYVAEITIQGSADFLYHKWNVEQIAEQSAAKKGSAIRKTDDLETYVYRNSKGDLAIPGEYLKGAIIGASKFRQDPRSPRKSAMDIVKAAIVSLTPLASAGQKHWDYEDKRRVVIQRNAITRTRPALKAGWTVTFQMMCNLPEYISPSFLNDLVASAGKLIGIGDFRPSYGRFQVVKFELIDLG